MSNVELLVPVVVVSVNGSRLTQSLENRLASVTVERTLSTCDRFELRFDASQDDARIASIGDAVEIAFHQDKSTTVLKAEVTGKSIEVRQGIMAVVISGYDKRHRLTRKIGTRAFNNMTLASVAQTIAGEHGLQFTDRTNGKLTKTMYPHIVQAGSDFEFLQHIAHRVGAAWLIEDAEMVFQVGPEKTVVATLSPERELLSFSLRFTPVENTSDVKVYGWDSMKGQPIVGSAANPQGLHSFQVATDERTKLPTTQALSWSTTVISQAEADGVADSIGRRLVNSAVVGHGETTGTPALVPGGLCKIEDVGADFSGNYHVTSVEHAFGGDLSYRTRFRIGPLEPSSLVDLLGGHEPAAGHAFDGVTIGVVTNVEHPEGRAGVVKVKLPYLGENIETDWARLISFGGGQGRGAAFIPEVDDEVLVAFEHGDVSRPYVLGTVAHSGKDDAYTKKVNGGKVEERSIESKLGTKIRFVDVKQGDQQSGFAIEVDDAKTRLFFGYKKTEIVTEKRPLELKNGRASVLLSNDEITLTADKITLTSSTGDINIVGKNVKVDAKANLSMAGVQVELKAQAQATLEASGIAIIKGSLVKVN